MLLSIPRRRRPLRQLGPAAAVLASLSFPGFDASAQKSPDRARDATSPMAPFTTVAAGEWSDVTPRFFAESGSYLYVDQADPNPGLSTSASPVDTLHAHV